MWSRSMTWCWLFIAGNSVAFLHDKLDSYTLLG